jgi:hypothetical protein
VRGYRVRCGVGGYWSRVVLVRLPLSARVRAVTALVSELTQTSLLRQEVIVLQFTRLVFELPLATFVHLGVQNAYWTTLLIYVHVGCVQGPVWRKTTL